MTLMSLFYNGHFVRIFRFVPLSHLHFECWDFSLVFYIMYQRKLKFKKYYLFALTKTMIYTFLLVLISFLERNCFHIMLSVRSVVCSIWVYKNFIRKYQKEPTNSNLRAKRLSIQCQDRLWIPWSLYCFSCKIFLTYTRKKHLNCSAMSDEEEVTNLTIENF